MGEVGQTGHFGRVISTFNIDIRCCLRIGLSQFINNTDFHT